MSSALDALCGSAISACSATTIRSTLADFYSHCTAELTSSVNTDVLRNYDVLYAMVPFSNAICSKDDSGNYCVANMNASSSSVPSVASLYTTLSSPSAKKRAQTPLTVVPNTQTFQSSSILFLLLTPTTPSSALCQSCTRDVLEAFTSFESDAPYGPGISQSPLLSSQSALYSAVESVCPSNFLSGGVQAAGGSLSSGLLGSSSGASRVTSGAAGVVVVGAAVLGLVAML